MREAFWLHLAALSALQGVVADGLGGLHPGFQIASLQGDLTV